MCAIAGILGLYADDSTLHKMLHTMCRRGPDATQWCDIENGYLLAKKKYRGSFNRIIPQLIKEHSEKYGLDKEKIYLIWTPGFTDELKSVTETAAKAEGYKNVIWMKTGCVITCHGGKGAFGVVGFNR